MLFKFIFAKILLNTSQFVSKQFFYDIVFIFHNFVQLNVLWWCGLPISIWNTIHRLRYTLYPIHNIKMLRCVKSKKRLNEWKSWIGCDIVKSDMIVVWCMVHPSDCAIFYENVQKVNVEWNTWNQKWREDSRWYTQNNISQIDECENGMAPGWRALV